MREIRFSTLRYSSVFVEGGGGGGGGGGVEQCGGGCHPPSPPYTPSLPLNGFTCSLWERKVQCVF